MTSKVNDNSSQHYKYLVIGAGPAGLQMGYWLKRAGSDYCLLERNTLSGSFFSKFPMTRKLISINKRYVDFDVDTDRSEVALRHDWNSLLSDRPDLRMTKWSKKYFPSADSYVNYLNHYASTLGLKIEYGQEVIKITKGQPDSCSHNVGESEIKSQESGSGKECLVRRFFVETTKSKFSCQYLIVATGVSQPYIPKNILGIEMAIGYENLDEYSLNTFEDKSVCILGVGNSALETAESLNETTRYTAIASRRPPVNAWKTHYVGNLRAVNNNFLDTFQLKSGNYMNYSFNMEIKKKGDQYLVPLLNSDYPFDYVIRCCGFKFDESIFDDSLRPELVHDKFPKIGWDFQSVNTEGLFFLGTISQSLDYKQGTLGFVHGFRYSAKFLLDLLDFKESGKPLEYQKVPFNIVELAKLITRESSDNSCIWQGFKFWCVVIVVDRIKQEFRVYRNLPVEWVKSSGYFEDNEVILLTHEYGFESDDDVFERFTTFQTFDGYLSKFIHPILRHYWNGNFTTPEHVQCLCGKWASYQFLRENTLCPTCYHEVLCGNCRNKLPCNAIETHRCGPLNKEFNTIHRSQEPESNINKDICHTLHVMEDLAGRYHTTSKNGPVSYRSELQVVVRYLDYLLEGKVHNVYGIVFGQKIKFHDNGCYPFFFYNAILNTSVITIKDGIIDLKMAEHDWATVQTNKKKSSYLDRLVKHLMETCSCKKVTITYLPKIQNILKG